MSPMGTGRISRRSFIGLVASTALAVPLLQACAGTPAATPTTAPAAASTTAPAVAATTAPAAAATAVPTKAAAAATTVPAAATPPTVAQPTAAATPTTAVKPTAATKGATISIIASAEDRPWLDYVQKQYQDARGGTFDSQTVAYDSMHNKIATAIAGGSAVDVVLVDTIWGAEFADAGFATAIDSYLTKDITDALVPHSLDPWFYKSKQWALPFSYYFKFYYYNTQVLEKGGVSAPPKTYEELIDVSKQLVDKKLIKYGQSWGWAQAEGLVCDWQQVMLAFGGDWFDKSGNWTFNQAGAVSALQYMVDNLKSKVFDPASSTLTDRTTMDVFARGDTAFMTNWGFAWSLVNDTKESKVPGLVKLTINPGTKVASVVSTSCGGGGGYAITPNTKNKDDAWMALGLMTGITKPENDVAKLKLVGAPPVLQKTWEDPTVIKDNPQFTEMIKQAPYMRHRPTIPWYTDFSKIVQIELSKALGFQKTPKQALDDAAAAVKAKGNPPV